MLKGYLWKDIFEFTGEERYKNAFLEICDGLLASQSENGFWMDFEPNDPNTGKIHARFNTWNAEALIGSLYPNPKSKIPGCCP